MLIELGAAIGMRKPYFYFNYGKKRTVRINNRHEPIATASDLAASTAPTAAPCTNTGLHEPPPAGLCNTGY